MNRKYRVIKLNGPFGLLLALLVAGTILGCIAIMPIYGVKFLWNTYVATAFSIPTIRLSQASLLWFAMLAAVAGYLKSKIGFKFVNIDNMEDMTMSRTDYEKFIEKIKEEQEENEKIHH